MRDMVDRRRQDSLTRICLLISRDLRLRIKICLRMLSRYEFLSVVREQWRICRQIASVGTCCLVGVICKGLIYIANAGDLRVVLGRADRECRR
ncbi:probable protein phosphatase 2C 38 [Helianthus annuus]|uniref:probable protein phosphatase 2C 38 n=1 Tax=Helianthus annuus TaxID=4232 RepID=UPI000B8FC9DB|nr:probable protein phosphatase 2C 38 [Helianthus annuus]